MKSFPRDRYGLIRREQALALGYTDEMLSAAIAAGDISRVAAGTYLPAEDVPDGPAGGDEFYRHRSIAVATSAIGRTPRSDTATPAILSHASAAAVHRLPTLAPDRSAVHLTNRRSAGGYRRGDRHVHNGLLPDDQVVLVDGLSVTSLERTAVDVAATGDFAQALVVFDAALRAGAQPDLMWAMLDDRRGRRGTGVARRSLEAANPAAESVGESWSRAQMIEAGLPVPELQVRYVAKGGSYYTDFSWNGLLVGEFDGMVKYGREHRPDESLRTAFLREKSREDDIRALGPMVLRWIWADLPNGSFLVGLREWLVRLGIMSAAA